MEARLAGLESDPDPYPPRRGVAPPGFFADLLGKPLALIFATACATAATASFMAYHFHDLSPYVLIGNPLTLSVIEFFAVPGALLGAALYPLGLDAPVWLYVGVGIKFILMCARFIAEAPGSTVHLPAFAPYALPFLALAVMSATIWRTFAFRASAIPFAIVGVIGATQGPRYDIIVAPSGDQVAVRDADGRLEIVGKRFNAFAAEQWLTADGDGREPSSARDPDAICDRLGCVAALPEGESLSIVLDPLAFDEDCARAEVVVSALRAPSGCRAKFVLDANALARLGAVGLTWDDETGFSMTSGRSAEQSRPWSSAPPDERIVRPGHAASHGADPADPDEEPGEGRR
jgi:competence protein ComEC